MLLVGLIPLVSMSAISLTTVESTIRRTADESVFTLAKEIGKEVRRTVNEAYYNLVLLAENPVVTSSTANREDQKEELSKTQKYHRILKDITLLDTKGRIRASVFFSFREMWKHIHWFKSALTGNSVLSDVHGVPSPMEFVMAAAIPIKDRKGKVKGVLVGQLDMERVWRITGNVSVGKSGEVFLVDHHGMIVAAPDRDRLLEPMKYDIVRNATIKGDMGSATLHDGKTIKIATYVPIPKDPDDIPLAWSVVVVQSKNEAYAAVFRTRYGLLVAAMVCVLVIAMLSPMLSRQVSDRVSTLVAATHRLGEGDFSAQVEDLGKDEIGELGRAFGWAGQQLAVSRQQILEYSQNLEELVEKRTAELKATQAQLVETAHMAGMAQMATGVLHNIGNAINSVNVRLKLAEERISKFNFKRLMQAAEMLESNSGELDHSLAEEPRGPKLLAYVKVALTSMDGHRRDVLSDMHFLSHQVSHVCEIVALQQSYAHEKKGLREVYRINEIVMDAVRMQSDILQRDNITVETDFSYTKPMLLDRYQLIQVLVNLVKNAIQAIEAQAPERKVIYIATRRAENRERKSPMLEVAVRDTGVGFTQDLKNKLFTYGFTTKEKGKGFGLHFCANYLQSIGGSIQAESTGPGKGAEFIIRIPIEKPKNK